MPSPYLEGKDMFFSYYMLKSMNDTFLSHTMPSPYLEGKNMFF